jgi:7-cyano-7-deazaguanine synthase
MTFKPLVLLSGGMDSTTALAYAIDVLGGAEPMALFVNYGQRHIREARSAEQVAQFYGLTLLLLDLRSYGRSVDSALTGHGEIPHGHYTADTMATTVVPNRNAVLLMAAAGIAASRGLTDVITAVHAGDHAIYPDCRPEFIAAAKQATLLGCEVGVQAPFAELSKAEIATLGATLNVPYELTWSCYEGDPGGHCGRCGTCVERAEAFHLAHVTDPTVYKDSDFWKQAVAR